MSNVRNPERYGGCLCGDVRYRLTGTLRPVMYCHCSQCRRASGHFIAATSVVKKDLVIETDVGLAWYASSDFASRGFCKSCGSSLFWSSRYQDDIAIMVGSLDHTEDLEVAGHIFVNDKGCYYELDDDLPKHPQSPSK